MFNLVPATSGATVLERIRNIPNSVFMTYANLSKYISCCILAHFRILFAVFFVCRCSKYPILYSGVHFHWIWPMLVVHSADQ